jgi:competence protein ComEA
MSGWRDALVVWFFVIVVVVTVVIAVYQWRDRQNAPDIIVLPGLQATTIKVEIAGAVATPGMYEVPVRSRVIDGIEAAGGIVSSADLSGINQVAFLLDGQKVTVPFESGGDSSRAQQITGGLININTATAEELDELPGIGEVRAQAIVDYRNQNGPFASVDELLAVDGISEGVLDDLRPYVTEGE